MTFAQKIIAFNKTLAFENPLPKGIAIMNPFKENKEAFFKSSEFYTKYYSDNQQRRILLGINPGRYGAGVTGVPFTDTKRLHEFCGLSMDNVSTHEPSSVFIYDVINVYGGAALFYKNFYINSICPLGFVINKKGKITNYNYYDSKLLTQIMRPFIIDSLKRQIAFGIDTGVCYCLGTGKNFKFLLELNNDIQLFKKIVPLEHPRYVQQYKSKNKQEYIDKYINALKQN